MQTAYPLQTIDWTAHTSASLAQNVGIDHRRADILVTQEFLNRSDVVASTRSLNDDA